MKPRPRMTVPFNFALLWGRMAAAAVALTAEGLFQQSASLDVAQGLAVLRQEFLKTSEGST